MNQEHKYMTPSHTVSMNLRFIEREVVIEHKPPALPVYRKVRILQQMMVPHDWSKHEEFWQDVPFVEGDFSNQGNCIER
jgi:hypothetical protein